MFGRQAYVGIASDDKGAMTLGRQYDSVVDYVAPFTATGSRGGTLFAHPFDNDNINETFRVDNSVKYTSADYAGLQFGGVYGFSNQAGAFSDNRAWSVGTKYQHGPLTSAAAFMNIDNASANASGAVAGSPYLSAQQRVAGVGANYAIGAATLVLVYTHTDIVDSSIAQRCLPPAPLNSTTSKSTRNLTSRPRGISARCTPTHLNRSLRQLDATRLTATRSASCWTTGFRSVRICTCRRCMRRHRGRMFSEMSAI